MNNPHTTNRILFYILILILFSGIVLADDISGPSEASGSLLVYPYYTSDFNLGWDTRITIANTDAYRVQGQAPEPVRQVLVHIFFIDGQSCNQSDQFICLTPYAAFTFQASQYDPGITGYLIAVAVDNNGNLIRQNSLIGDAFVFEGKYIGNYGAEAFRAYGNPGIANDGIIYFGQRPGSPPQTNAYDYAPVRFTFNIQSVLDAPGQRVVTSSISGDINSSTFNGAGQSAVAGIYNGNERPFVSFAGFLNGTCQAIAVFTPTAPRVPLGLVNIIPSGQIGTVLLPTGPAVGLLMTPQGNSKWSGIRGLHKALVAPASLAIPLLIPVC